MKIIALIVVSLVLSGCTTIETKSSFNMVMANVAPGAWYGVVNYGGQLKNEIMGALAQ